LVRSELTLALRPVSVAFSPTLSADDPAHRQLLSAAGTAPDARVRIAQLESGPLLRMGTLGEGTPEKDRVGATDEGPRPRSRRYDLWLKRARAGWELEVSAASSDKTSARPGIVGTVALSRKAPAEEVGTFSAALIPTADNAGQLVLRWDGHEWAADFRFADQPPRKGERRQAGGLDGARPFDADTSAIARGSRLAERHEAALVLPDDSRISVLFWKSLSVENEDFASLSSVADGAVVRLTQGAVTRLKTDVPLRFGGVTIPTGNLASGFPGAYGLWLKRAGRGWRLVFNHEADSWGTQHNSKFRRTQPRKERVSLGDVEAPPARAIHADRAEHRARNGTREFA
jgi:hypothetical protein